MHSRNEELSLADEIKATERQLHVYDGLMTAMRDIRAVLDIVLEAEDVDAARSELRARLGLEELQANAVLDLQFRRAPTLERGRIEERRDEIVAHLEFLRELRSAKGTGEEAASTFEVDGEVFELRRAENGGTQYDWISGPNPGYGYSSNAAYTSSEQAHRTSIRRFLSMIDPATGYIEDD